MIKRCLPVILALVLVGCSDSATSPASSISDTAIESNSAVSENEDVSAITVGDYTVDIPTSWSNNGEFYYPGDVGTLPYVYVHLVDDFAIDDLLNDSDGFIEGTFEAYDNAKLTAGMSPVKYYHASGYSFSFSGTTHGYDTNNIFTFFDNPSGGIVTVSLMEEGYDYLPQYYAILNTVTSNAPLSNDDIPDPTPEETKEPEDIETDSDDSADSPAPEADASAPSTGEFNALNKANSYLSFSAFSYSGLVEQLEYEGFTHEEAVYGADHCGADWKEQALQKANSYLSFSAFSYSGLIDQLEYEGFAHEEAEYGVDKCGADWKEQAAKKAADYLEFSSFSRNDLIDQLEYEGFTHEEAEYGVSQSYD